MRKTVYVVTNSYDCIPLVYTNIKNAISSVCKSLKWYAKKYDFTPDELREALDDFYEAVDNEYDYCGSYIGEYHVGFHVTQIQD